MYIIYFYQGAKVEIFTEKQSATNNIAFLHIETTKYQITVN